MRRSKGKLSKFNWQLVLLAGIFQILTFVFDQIAIQNEEKLRINNFEILKTTESRSAFLRIQREPDAISAFEELFGDPRDDVWWFRIWYLLYS